MDIHSVWDVLRIFNALASGVVFVGLIFYVRVFWNTYGPQRKLMFMTYMAYAFTATYGSYEAYVTNVPGGSRILILTIANIPALIAIIKYRGKPIT